MSLESTSLLFSPSLCLRLACSCSYHIFDTPVTTWNPQTADATWRAAFGELILRKIITTRCHILRPKIDFGWGSAPDPAGLGSLQRSAKPPSWNKGDLLLSKGEIQEGEGEDKEGRQGRGEDWRGGEGNGGEPRMYLYILLRIAYAIIG